MDNKKRIIISIIIICLVFIGIGAGINCFKYFESKKYVPEKEIEKNQADNNVIVYEGKEYVYNYKLKNILFLGIDNDTEIVLENRPGTGGQADCIMLLSMDTENNTSKILQISRDSMTEIDIYDTQGSKYTSISAQLAAQYAYGNTPTTSCWATKNTVSELLYGLPIYGYVSLDIAGIPLMNEYVGGVSIKFKDDFTEIDDSFVKGTEVKLTGEQAEKFVRYRDTKEKGSNQKRMERQVHYIPVLTEKLISTVGESQEKLDEFNDLMEPYMTTDLTSDDVSQMAEYEWLVDNVLYVPGDIKEGKEHEEFHINYHELQKMIIETFYVEKND